MVVSSIKCIFFHVLDMIAALSSLAADEKQDPCVAFALSFRSAWSLKNYHQVLKLYSSAPKMAPYLIDMFIARERIQALKIMVKAYVFINIYFHLHFCLENDEFYKKKAETFHFSVSWHLNNFELKLLLAFHTI